MKFKKIYIEITNVCNLNCSFCQKIDRQLEFMNVETFKTIIKDIKEYTDYIYLHVKGEPLLHKEIYNFIDIAGKEGLKVNITSNGTILNHKILELEGLRQFNFSLHSFEEESGINKTDYIQSILEYSKEAKAKGKIVSLRLWNIEDESLREKNRDVLTQIEEFYGISLDLDKFVRGRGVKLEDKIYLNFEEVFVWPNLNNKFYSEKGFCYGLNTHLGVLVDGTVIPCCLDDNGVINLGNIKNNTLKEILDSERTKNIIEGFKNRICTEELCKRCEFKERF